MNIKKYMKSNFIKLIAFGLVGLLGLILIFEVPYIFPPSNRTISASYDYGFNNTVGILILFIVCTVFVGFGFYWTRRGTEITILIDLKMQSKEIFIREILITSLVSFFLIFVLFYLSGSYGFGESTQFILAMERLSVGQLVYSDFDFYYGPLLAYGPYAIYKSGHFLNIEYKTAYFLSLAALQILSLIELRYILNTISHRPGLKRIYFYIIALSTLPFHSGINLILFRFITPIVGLIFIKKCETKSLFAKSLIVFALSFLTFGISIEYGVVFTIAVCIYFLSSFVFDRASGSVSLIIVTIIAPVVFYGLFPGLFHTMHLYMLGAWRWPFVPSLHLILFFVSVFIVAFFIGSELRDVRKNYFLISLCILAIGSLPAALGRCDPGHVILNGLMIFIISYSYISFVWNKKYAALMNFLFITAFSIFYNYTTIIMYSGIYISQAFKSFSQSIPARDISTFIELYSKITGMKKDDITQKIGKFNKIQALDLDLIFNNINNISSPYMISENIAKFLSKKNKIEFLYFKDFSILASDSEVALAINDMKKKDPEFLILPIWWDKISDEEDNNKFISFLFTTKYARMPIRNGRLLLSPIVNYVNEKYILDASFENFVIMKRLASH